MTIISAISNLGSAKASSLKQLGAVNSSSLSFNKNQTANAPAPHQHSDNSTHLANVGILANVLGIIGLDINAKVL